MLSEIFVIACLTLLQPCASEYSPVVELTHGKIRGQVETFRGNRVYDFLGIPYAQAPIDSLRFVKPIDPIPWDGVRNTTEYGKSCLQNTEEATSSIKAEETSEDCLFLNVFVNEKTFLERDTVKKPVLFWIHGGSFMTGSGNELDAYRGTALTTFEDVIVVTINYRLNIFGFFYPGGLVPGITGNMGMWDQNFALKWTKKHIALFGGDPEAITIFGESAGATSVSAHVLSPISRGLFVGAIMESGCMRESDRHTRSGVSKASSEIVMSLGCLDAEDILNCLQQVDANTLKKYGMKNAYRPSFGDEFLPKVPIAEGNVNPVNLMVGVEKDDGVTFITGIMNEIDFTKLTLEEARRLLKEKILTGSTSDSLIDHYLSPGRNMTPEAIRDAFSAAGSDNIFICMVYGFGHRVAAVTPVGTIVYGYYQTQRPKKSFVEACTQNPWMGVCHSDDLHFVFGIPFMKPEDYSKEDVELSLRMMNIWAEFARTGKPPKQGSTNWPRFHESGPNDVRVMDLNVKYIGQTEKDRPKFCIENGSQFSNRA